MDIVPEREDIATPEFYIKVTDMQKQNVLNRKKDVVRKSLNKILKEANKKACSEYIIMVSPSPASICHNDGKRYLVVGITGYCQAVNEAFDCSFCAERYKCLVGNHGIDLSGVKVI